MEKIRWEKIPFYKIEDVFGFDPLKTFINIKIKKNPIESLSENEKIYWDYYIEYNHPPKVFYNNNGKLVVR